MFGIDKTTKRFALGIAAVCTVTAVAFLVSGSPAGSRSTTGKPAAAKSNLKAPWRLLPEAPFSVAAGRTTVWTGHELIVAGTNPGPDGTFIEAVEVAEAYNPVSRTWRELPSPPKTQSFCRRDAVWTGKELLVWGCSLTAFDPATNQWRLLAAPPTGHGVAAWTGKELIGWGGGCCGDANDDGSAYNPSTNSWRKLARSPLAPSQSAAGAWTGHELVLYVSGLDPEGKPVKGAARAAAYSPATDTWRRITPLPARDRPLQSLWDGRKLIVLGTEPGATVAFFYNPETSHLRKFGAIAPEGGPAVSVWTGRQALFLNLRPGRRDGLAYYPKDDRSVPFGVPRLPTGVDPAAAWTGRELILFGGIVPTPSGASGPPRYLRDGVAFTPPTKAPPPLPGCCGGG